MQRRALGVITLAAALLAGPAAWGAPPDAGKVRLAGEEFDAGARAFKSKEYESAASHFEAADAAAPGAKALRLAIRARSEAGQGSRAATLAALALDRYPGDAETASLARDIIDQNEAILFKVSVRCISPCVLAAGTRAMHGEATTRWVVYLDPGKTMLSASFLGSAGSASRDIDATAGGKADVRFEPAEKGSALPPAGPPPAAKPKEQPPVPPAKEATPEPAAPPGKGLPPFVFIGGAVLTAGLGGVTIWSGLDAKNNPGVDAVRAACAGQTTDCPEYQDGVSRQNRTNLLIGATAGAGALTILVGALFTNWQGASSTEASAVHVIAPAIAIADGGGSVALGGRF